jgi:hypothetical protein
MHLRLSRLGREEEGFALIPTLGAIALITVLVTVSLAAANGDLHLVQRDLDTKRSYAAAQAGVIDYAFHLNNDPNYWAHCTDVPGKDVPGQSAVNQVDSTVRRRTVPGSTDGSQYAIELLPASAYTGSPNQCNPTNPVDSMLEKSGPNAGTFRIRSTGYEGNGKRSIVATFRQSSFLDYVYFTQLETSDPVTYGYANPSPELQAAYDQCTKFRRDGRPRSGSTTPSQICDTIVFVDGDNIKGPMHTNDDFCVAASSSPTFGRSAADPIEVSASSPGWHTSTTNTGNGCTGTNASPNFAGSLVPNAPILLPKPIEASNLQTLAGPTYTYTGQTKIELSGSSMRINGGSSVPVPNGGVLYIKNGSCSTSYSPFTATYPATSGCGNAIVHTSSAYTSQLTIAAENDIIIDGSIQRASDATGLLGLVASNFIRVMHPICPNGNAACDITAPSTQTAKGACNNGINSNQSLNNPEIDAALLAIDHSFIVDHYDCGGTLANLNVTGAIAQKFRGAVGTNGGSGTGYKKNYVYDDHLRYEEPPEGFDPSNKSWHVGRETLDFP